MLLAGFIAAGFITLTGFAAKTLAEQRAEIDAAVTAKLTELRTMKQQECDERVAAEAGIRFDAVMAEKAAAEAKMPGKKTVKKGGTKVDPIPAGTKPVDPAQAKKDKMQGTPNTEEKKDKMQQAPNTDKKKDKMKQQQGGGGK